MKEYIIEKQVCRFLIKNPNIGNAIVSKMKDCLIKYLLEPINLCNKHELKGNCKGFWRLHVPYGYVLIYKIEGRKDDRYAKILKIMTEEKYHKWISQC